MGLEGYYGFNANISLTFQAVKSLSAYPTYLLFGQFCTLFGDFWVYLRIIIFFKGLVKVMAKRNNFGRFLMFQN